MQETTLKDYREFCTEHLNCESCPLCGDEVTGIYEHCMGFISEYPEKADNIIREWKAAEEKRKIDKRQTVCVICDRCFSETIYGVASSYEMAIKMLDALGQEALANCLAVDAEDSGIYWDKMTKEQQQEFYDTQIKSAFIIKEMKMDCYTYDDEEVHTI